MAATFGNIVYAGGTSHQYEGTQTSETASFTSAVSIGQRVVICIANEANSKVVSNITGSNGEIATFRGKAQQSSVHNGELWDYIATNSSSAGSFITVKWSSSENTTRNYVMFTVNGTAATGQPDVAVIATISSGFNTTINTSITSSTDGDFIAGMIVHQGDNSFSLLNGTIIGTGALALGGSVGVTVRPFYTVKSPAGGFGPGGTLTNNENVIVILVAYKPGKTYYVDFLGGADTNVGTASVVPWKHCVGDINATNIPSSSALSAGDTVVFKGGVTYVGEVVVKTAGSAGQPITYDGTGTTWGSGRAIIDCTSSYYHAFYGNSNKHFITLNGFEILGCKNSNNATNVTNSRNGIDQVVSYFGDGDIYNEGGIMNIGGTDWIMDGLYVHHFENWSDTSVQGAESDPDPNTPIDIPCTKTGIEMYNGAHNCIIRNCTLHAIGRNAIKLFGVQNFLITNCDIGGSGPDKGWFAVAIKLSGVGAFGAGPGTCSFVTAHDGWQYQGDDPLQRSHAGDWCHFFGDNDGILESTSDVHDVLVDSCYFYSDKLFQYYNGTAYFLIESDCYNIELRNCLFVNDFSGVVEVRDTENFLVNNCTFISNGTQQPIELKQAVKRYANNITLKNNIFYTNSTHTAVVPAGTSNIYTGSMVTSDYNRYYSPNNGDRLWYWNGTYYSTLAAWRSFSGQDLNSTYGDPGILNITSPDSASSGTYTLASGSACINTGTTISTVPIDKIGTARPQGLIYDIGAFEFVTSSLSPTITTGHIILGNIRLIGNIIFME